MNVEIKKVSNGFIITVSEREFTAYVGIMGTVPQTANKKEYVASTLDSAIDKLREIFK